jgi:hypothetical protein
VSRLKAFLLSGLLIVIFATGPRLSTKVNFPSLIMNKPFLDFAILYANNTTGR